jgi:cytochrome c-type biogenesis protein CcmH/NrfG
MTSDDELIDVFSPQETVDLTRMIPREEIDAMLAQGVKHHQAARLREAMECYREVLRADPEHEQALYYTAIILSQQKQPEDQIVGMMEHAIRNMPNVPEAQYNLGILYHRLKQPERAIPLFERAVKLNPKFVEAKTSLGGSYLNIGDRNLGRKWITAAATTETKNQDSVYSRSFARLTIGDLYGGFVDYDMRWRSSSFLVDNKRNFGKIPFWNGKPTRVLYVHTEQGAGDVIMMSRFLEEVRVRSRCERLIVEVGASLVPFFSRLACVDDVIASNTPSPEVPTAYLPFMSIPRRIGLFSQDKITSRDGWFTIERNETLDKIQARVPGRLQVGISWAGSKSHTNDRYRSQQWESFRDALCLHPALIDRVTWHSLQVGDYASQFVWPEGTTASFIDPTPAIKSFAETAQACKNLDLIVGVDTATMHTAAALVDGPPMVMFVPSAPDWRWLLEGDRTAWSNRITMIRQRHHMSWADELTVAVEHVRDAC